MKFNFQFFNLFSWIKRIIGKIKFHLIEKINEEGKKNGKKITINENDYTEIKNNMGLLTPLKPIVNPKNKEYHSNWSSVIEVKKANQQVSIDNILNKEEEESNDVFGQIVTNANDDNEKEDKNNENKEKEKKIK